MVSILNGQKAQVNCLKWIHSEGNYFTLTFFAESIILGVVEEYLVSGSADKSVRVWKWNGKMGELMSVLEVTLVIFQLRVRCHIGFSICSEFSCGASEHWFVVSESFHCCLLL